MGEGVKSSSRPGPSPTMILFSTEPWAEFSFSVPEGVNLALCELPLNSFQDFVDLPVARKLAKRLRFWASSRWKALTRSTQTFPGAVAPANQVDPPSNADRLTVVEVDDGRRTYQVGLRRPRRHRRPRLRLCAPRASHLQGRN